VGGGSLRETPHGTREGLTATKEISKKGWGAGGWGTGGSLRHVDHLFKSRRQILRGGRRVKSLLLPVYKKKKKSTATDPKMGGRLDFLKGGSQ